MNKYHSHCLTNGLIKVAKVDPHLASAICEEAHEHLSDHNIASMSLHGIIRKFGGAAAATEEMRNSAVFGFQDNSTNSTEKGNPGVPDKKYPVSSYGDSYDSCVTSLSKITNSEVAKEDCARVFKGIPPGNKTANRKTYPTIKTSKVIQVHNARKLAMEGIEYGQHLKKASIEVEPEVPAWAILEKSYARDYTPNLPGSRNGSTNIKSAREQGDNMLYTYMQAREISHRDGLNSVPVNPDLEEMIQKKAALLETYNEIARLKQAAKKPVQEEFKKPAWAICANL